MSPLRTFTVEVRDSGTHVMSYLISARDQDTAIEEAMSAARRSIRAVAPFRIASVHEVEPR